MQMDNKMFSRKLADILPTFLQKSREKVTDEYFFCQPFFAKALMDSA